MGRRGSHSHRTEPPNGVRAPSGGASRDPVRRVGVGARPVLAYAGCRCGGSTRARASHRSPRRRDRRGPALWCAWGGTSRGWCTNRLATVTSPGTGRCHGAVRGSGAVGSARPGCQECKCVVENLRDPSRSARPRATSWGASRSGCRRGLLAVLTSSHVDLLEPAPRRLDVLHQERVPCRWIADRRLTSLTVILDDHQRLRTFPQCKAFASLVAATVPNTLKMAMLPINSPSAILREPSRKSRTAEPWLRAQPHRGGAHYVLYHQGSNGSHPGEAPLRAHAKDLEVSEHLSRRCPDGVPKVEDRAIARHRGVGRWGCVVVESMMRAPRTKLHRRVSKPIMVINANPSRISHPPRPSDALGYGAGKRRKMHCDGTHVVRVLKRGAHNACASGNRLLATRRGDRSGKPKDIFVLAFDQRRKWRSPSQIWMRCGHPDA